MDTRTLFQKISQRMRTDFEATAQITHNGNKGMSREAILRELSHRGRLPKRFGIGTGEIIGQANDTSRQCDIVIYDLLNGVSLLYDDTNQVFPIDCVYGVIEVSSRSRNPNSSTHWIRSPQLKKWLLKVQEA